MDVLTPYIPLLPFIAAALLGIGQFSGLLAGERSERITARLSLLAMSLACMLALTVLAGDLLGKNVGTFNAGCWLNLGSFSISLTFISTSLSCRLASLFCVLLLIITHFSINYMHREAGFHRFFFVLNLFGSAMLLLVLSGSTLGTFVGWEIAGFCSYLLIAYFYERPVAVTNATRVVITNRIGDAGFLIGIGLSAAWLDSFQWQDITTSIKGLSSGKVTVLALCFALAAVVKSAQLPFTPWLANALEGPTPSSAVFYGAIMIHAGVYLLCLLSPLYEQVPRVMLLIAAIGLLTALYSFFVGLTQTDVKSALIFSTSGQLGLMFLACGLGWWQLASWHMGAHAIVRGYQLLMAPGLMHAVQNNPIKPVNTTLARQQWAYNASLGRGWLDPLTDWAIVKPVRGLADDLAHFDEQYINRLLGVAAPTIQTLSSLAQRKEHTLGARLDNGADDFAQGSGLAGKLTQWSASVVNWFEDRFVLQNHRKGSARLGRQLGHTANSIEQLLLRPRNLVLLVFILLLTAF